MAPSVLSCILQSSEHEWMWGEVTRVHARVAGFLHEGGTPDDICFNLCLLIALILIHHPIGTGDGEAVCVCHAQE